jgi:lipoprotein-releasing system permease protein
VNLPIRLAWRYAWTRRSRSITHLISGISMFVIAAVTAAMIAVLSAFNGIESVVTELFGTLDAPLAIVSMEGNALPDSTGEWLEAHFGMDSDSPLLEHIAPVIEDEAVLSWNGNAPQVVKVLAFDSTMLHAADIERALRGGTWSPEWAQGSSCVALGLGVRNVLGIGSLNATEDKASLLFRAPIRGKKMARYKENAFQSERAFACDVFSVNAEIDRKYVLAPLDFARLLFQRNESVNRFEIRPVEGSDDDEIARIISAKITEQNLPWRVRTRDEKNALITQTNRAEKWATFVILSFILVVAAFNVMASLTMLLLEKRQDIEVLNAMGLTGWRLEQVFAWQGVLINAIGGAVGMGVGVGLVWGQRTFGWVKLQGSVIPSYPVELALGDVLGTLAVVVFLGGIGSGWMVRNLVHRFIER